MMAFILGGITLSFPPTPEQYRLRYRVVKGREVTALSGKPLSLGVVRKKEWTICFYPGDQYADIMALVGTETTFTDHDGSEYTVMVLGEPEVSQYPIDTLGMMTLILREV